MYELTTETKNRVLDGARAFFTQYLTSIQLGALEEDEVKAVLRKELSLSVCATQPTYRDVEFKFLSDLFSMLIEQDMKEHALFSIVNSSLNTLMLRQGLQDVRATLNFNVPIVVWLASKLAGVSPYSRVDLLSRSIGLNKDLFMFVLALLDRTLDHAWLNSHDVLYALEYGSGMGADLIVELMELTNRSPELTPESVDYNDSLSPSEVALVEIIRNLLLITQASSQKRVSGIPNRYHSLGVNANGPLTMRLPLFATLCALSEQVSSDSIGVLPNAKASYDFELTLDKLTAIGYSIQE